MTLLLALSIATATADTPPTSAETPPAPPEIPAAPAGALPDISQEAVRGRCEVPPADKEVLTAAGADQNYLGAFTLGADGSVTGYERRLLFANETWTKSPGEDGVSGYDCVNHWDVKGTVIRPSACRDCDFAIEFQADIDYTKSTCPQRLVVDGNHFRASYDVKKRPDGTIEVFFSNSGNKLGRGYFRGQEFTWISNHRCVWL